MNFKENVLLYLKESNKSKDYEEKRKVAAGCEADGSSVKTTKKKKTDLEIDGYKATIKTKCTGSEAAIKTKCTGSEASVECKKKTLKESIISFSEEKKVITEELITESIKNKSASKKLTKLSAKLEAQAKKEKNQELVKLLRKNASLTKSAAKELNALEEKYERTNDPQVKADYKMLSKRYLSEYRKVNKGKAVLGVATFSTLLVLMTGTIFLGLMGVSNPAGQWADIGQSFKSSPSEGFEDLFNFSKKIFRNAGSSVKEFFSSLGGNIKDSWGEVERKSKELRLKDWAGETTEKVKDGLDNFGDKFGETTEKVKDWAGKTTEKVKDDLESFGNKVGEKAENFGNKLENGLDKFGDKMEEYGEKVKDSFDSHEKAKKKFKSEKFKYEFV